MDKFKEIIGWVSGGLTILYHLAPLYPFSRVLIGKLNFEDSPGAFVTTCYMNCFAWYAYGDTIFSEQIKYSYLVAAGVSLIFMIIYLAYELKKYLVDTILNILILITASFSAHRALMLLIYDDRIVGAICTLTSIVVYATPMHLLYKVIKDKNYIIIPINFALIYLLACISWIIYGVLITDFFVICSHSIGAIFL